MRKLGVRLTGRRFLEKSGASSILMDVTDLDLEKREKHFQTAGMESAKRD